MVLCLRGNRTPRPRHFEDRPSASPFRSALSRAKASAPRLAWSQGTWGALDAASALLADGEGETHKAGWTVATVYHMAYHGC